MSVLAQPRLLDDAKRTREKNAVCETISEGIPYRGFHPAQLQTHSKNEWATSPKTGPFCSGVCQPEERERERERERETCRNASSRVSKVP